MKKKFTIEIEVEEESYANYYGEDLLYVMCDHIGRAVTELGYERGSVKYHNGRSSRELYVRAGTAGEPATIHESPRYE